MSEDDDIHPPKKAKSVKSQTDYISALPDDILSSILSCCTVRDVVSTSLLSRRWRHLCALMSTLSFDCFSMFQDDQKTIITTTLYHDEERQPCSPHYKERFVRGVNQFLQFYKGSHLECFKISYCLEKDCFDDVDQWVRFAVSKGVKRLHLNLACILVYQHKLGDQYGKLYTLKSELLLSDGKVTKLKQLYLDSCTLEPSVIHQFSCLKSLDLVRVPLGNLEVESILCCCLNLESMRLASCPLPLKLCISAGTLPRLKYLSVYGCYGVEEIELSAATLTSFEYIGCLIKFSISKLPNLQQVYFRPWDEKGVEYVFNQLGNYLPTVKRLSVFADTDWVQCAPNHIARFSRVKKLEVFFIKQQEFKALKIIRILNSCPLLEKLYIVRSSVKYSQNLKEMRVPTRSVHKHLKEVHMGGFRLRIGYIKFARYMMEYAAALERMVIDPQLKAYIGYNGWMYSRRKTWDEGEREAIWAQLKDSSKSAMIVLQ